MIKEYCDFCKKEVEGLQRISKEYPDDFAHYNENNSIELCPECYNAFNKFEKDHRDKLNNELNTYVNMHLS